MGSVHYTSQAGYFTEETEYDQESRYSAIATPITPASKRTRAEFTPTTLETDTPSSIRHTPPGTLNASSYLHIFELIIDCSSPPALALLLRCSKSTFEFAATRLYRNLRVSKPKFLDMLETCWPRSNRLTASGRGSLGRSSATMRQALGHVRTLCYTDETHAYSCSQPAIPPGCLDRTHTMIANSSHPGLMWFAFNGPDILHTHRNITHVFVRMLRSASSAWPAQLSLDHRPTSVTDLTLLLPLPAFLDVPLFSPLSESLSVKLKLFTHVLLPTFPSGKAPATVLGSSATTGVWNRIVTQILIPRPRYAVRIVGAEYYGYTAADLADRLPIYRARRLDFAAGAPLIFQTFREWLDEQEHGVVFSAQEELELRKADKALVARAFTESEDDRYGLAGTWNKMQH